MKKFIALILALLLTLTCFACKKTDPPADPSTPTGSATDSPTDEPPTTPDDVYAPVEVVANLDNISLNGVDPHLSPTTGITHLVNIFNGLMRVNEDTLKTELDLAESVDVSADGLVYTFKLRQGVQFHKGYGEMTSEDVVFSLLRARDHENSQHTKNMSIVKDVVAVDTYTVEVTLNNIFPDFLFFMSDELGCGHIISKKFWEEVGDEGMAGSAVGTGPFVFDEANWIPQQSSHFISFEDYFKGAPKINLTISEIKDGSTALLAMQNKEIDFLLSSQLEIVTEAEASGAVVDFKAAPIFFGLFFNGDVYEPFKNPKVREALYHAIDRETNRKAVFGEYMARPMEGVMADVLPGFTMDGVQTISYDPELAKQMLKEEGYENSIEFTAIIQNNIRNERIFTLLQKNFSDIGVTMNVQAVSTTEYYSMSEERKVACSYSSVTGMPSMFFLLTQNYQGGQLRNYTDYTGCDDLIEKIGKTPDGPERDALYKEAQQRLSNDMPYFPHHAVNVILVHLARLQGVYSKGANGGDVRFDKAFIAE